MDPLLQRKEHFIERDAVCALIEKLADNLVNIKDETGEFLLRLDDGRVIDTKGWAGWEWTHGIGLYGLLKYREMTGSALALDIITRWFSDRLAEGTPTRNVNTVAPFLTLAHLYEETRNPVWRPYLESWAECARGGESTQQLRAWRQKACRLASNPQVSALQPAGESR